MTTPHASPIAALIAYYQRLSSAGDVAAFGYSRQKISFRVVIESTGEPFAIEDARQQTGRRLAPQLLVVPGQSKSAGQGINPCFLWDNAQYMLGVKAGDTNPERTARAFAAFRQRHLDLATQVDDEHFAAVCRFLKGWDPANVAQVQGHELLEELEGGFGVFQVRGQAGYVHDRPAIKAYWQQQLDARGDDAGGPTGESLVSGRTAPLARLHEPKIKGVSGGQSAGGVLVGFNEDAYTSYGKTQSYNAPVTEDEAFEYATALNHLLGDDGHRVRLGDATVVYWSEQANEMETVLSAILGGEAPPDKDAEDPALTQRIAGFLDALRRGRPHEGINEPDAAFYILGLSPNAARVSVRFWLSGTVGDFAKRLADHVQNLEMTGARDDRPLTVARMLRETAREAKDIPPQLAGEVGRSILTGAAYPMALMTAVLRRLRADQVMNHPRAATLKACLIHNHQMEVTMALNKDHADAAYHMGRLFAALEKTQQDALPGLNKTIKDGYFATASTTPSAVFPRLIRLHQHHIEKLEGGFKVNRERLIQEVCGHIDQFSAHLSIERQGLFHIGYYHQRQDFFTKRENADPQAPSEEEPAHV
ncbi:MAG: type I-C CRISPR-associated protein Cas8c/Csd1 [Phycisphaeraceae bacterium]